MEKIMIIQGSRPETLRLSVILKKLDKLANTILVHTGQNYDERLNDIFFKELELRAPNYSLGVKTGNFGEQIGLIFTKIDEIITKESPSKVLILGDTNSALAAIIAEKKGTPVFHMEAGNRCFDRTVPEEINRKLVDSISTYNLPYTQLSKENLLKDGISKDRIFVTGNPIYEVMETYKAQIDSSTIFAQFNNIIPQHYFLATFHRAENVDNPSTLRKIIRQLESIAQYFCMPVICSIHPRTANKIREFNVEYDSSILLFNKPFGFFDFVKLEKNAKAILSDSGTVGEEACILGVPHIIMRNSTERQELVECGASILAGLDGNNILEALRTILSLNHTWKVPEEYLYTDVSDRVVKILQGAYKWK